MSSMQYYNSVVGYQVKVSGNNVGIGTSTPSYKLDVSGTFSADSVNVNDAFTLPTGDGTDGQVLATDGSGNVQWEHPRSSYIMSVMFG